MIKPRALKPGDRLAVVAPASPFSRQEFELGIAELRGLGFVPVYDETVFARRGYVAGDASVRAAAISRAWRDPSVAGLIAVRGGYGSVQVLPWLNANEAREAAKVFIGYSDLTSILTFLNTSAELVCFHGPTVAGKLGRGVEGYDRDSFQKLISQAEPFGEMAPAGLETLKTGEASGVLYGGTLSQLISSLGTPFAFNPPRGSILFLEEVGERPYRIDRMLTQLRLSGIIERAAGLVLGQLPGCDEPESSLKVRTVVADVLANFRGPILYGFPSGHTTGPAMTLPFGVQARVIAGMAPRLVIEESAVEA